MIIWEHCYNDSWQGVLTPEAFAHPAKFARGLIIRIYQHMRESGYLAPGDRVIDPFAGVGGGALDAMRLGLHWTGCELESRFVELGNANIDKWQRDLAMLNGTLGTARLLQGDSRQLAAIVGAGVAGVVSSPPFADSLQSQDVEFENARQAAKGRDINGAGHLGSLAAYGSTPGQLGSMRSGDFAAAVSSPPYVDAVNGTGEGPGARHDTIHHNGDNAYKASSANGYGATPGNLGNLPGNGFSAAISSPPFGGEAQHTGGPMPLKHFDGRQAPRVSSGMVHGDAPYGDTLGQIATLDGETFWTAARAIVEQTYLVLRPGGYAAFVTKDFVRKGQRVPFSDQWEALCVAVGFVPVERIAAMLVEEHGDQLDIFGGTTARRKERKSFFRRLAEAKGSPRIDHEDVIIMRKPCPLT